MSQELHIDIGGVMVPVVIPDGAVPVRAIVIVSTEHLDSENNVRECFTWGASAMGTDPRVGMITRAYHRITDRARRADRHREGS